MSIRVRLAAAAPRRELPDGFQENSNPIRAAVRLINADCDGLLLYLLLEGTWKCHGSEGQQAECLAQKVSWNRHGVLPSTIAIVNNNNVTIVRLLSSSQFRLSS